MIKSLFRFFNTDGLLKDSSVLLLGMAGVNVLNLLFQVVMGRCLEKNEFALLIALIGLLNIFVIPLGVMSSTLNRYASLLLKEGRAGDIRRMVLLWGGRLALVGGVCSIGCFIAPDRVAHFLHLERTAPVFIFGVILTGVFCRPVFDGALLGMQCFKIWSLNSLLGWGLRLAVGTYLVLFISPFAGWGLLGHGLGFYAATLSGLFFVIWRLHSEKKTSLPLPRVHGYILGSFFVMLGYSLLMTGDVILLKHPYPEAAGDFSYAATLGRLVIFVPQAFIASMFPKVVSEVGGTNSQCILYLKTLLITFLVTLVSAIVFSLFVKFMLNIIYGIDAPSSDLILWSRVLAWVMIPVALLNVSIRFALAQKNFKAALVLVPAGGLYLFIPFCWRGGVLSVLQVLSVLSVLTLGVVLLCVLSKPYLKGRF